MAELIEVDDFDGEETAKSKCFSIAGDIVSALIRDRRDLQKVYYFNAETVNMREFENAGDGYCGCDCSLVLAQPMTFNYKPANWNL